MLMNKKDVLILGIESSCDETSIAVVKNGREVFHQSFHMYPHFVLPRSMTTHRTQITRSVKFSMIQPIFYQKNRIKQGFFQIFVSL